MLHWGFYQSGKEIEPWFIAPAVLSTTEIVRWTLLLKNKLNLWDYPHDIWVRMNKEQLGSYGRKLAQNLWEYFLRQNFSPP